MSVAFDSVDGLENFNSAIVNSVATLDSIDCPACPDTLGIYNMRNSGQFVIFASDFANMFPDSFDITEYRLWYSFMDSASYPDQSRDWQMPTDSSSGADVLFYVPKVAVFYCEALRGVAPSAFEVLVYGVDEDGDWSSCSSKVVVTDTFNICGHTQLYVIFAGKIENCMGDVVDNVLIELTGGQNTQEQKFQIVDKNGAYAFLVRPGYNWNVTGEKDDSYLNGVTVQDLSLLIRHLNGTSILENPYKKLACDVNADYHIDIRDMIPLRKLLLGIIDEFERVNPWEVLDADYNFASMTDYSIPEGIWDAKFIKRWPLESDELAADFIAVKMGDLDGDADPTSLTSAPPALTNSLEFALADQTYRAGELVVVPILAGNFNNVTGIQFTMEYDTEAFDIVDVQSNKIDVDFSMESQAGTIPMIWYSENPTSFNTDDVLFNVLIRAKKKGYLSETISIGSTITEAAAFSREGEKMELKLKFQDAINDDFRFELMQNYPNPTSGETKITFNLPQAQYCELFLFSVDGNELERIKIDGRQGLNAIEINTRQLPRNNIIFYQLKTEGFSAAKKMVIK